MQKISLLPVLTMTLVILSLTACGSHDLPVALTQVEDSDGQQVSLIEATGFQGVPSHVANEAMSKYDRFKNRVKNRLYISIVDFSQHSGRLRYFLINTKTGKVDSLAVAHGTGSDPDADGRAQYFSNRVNSKMTSLGSYLVSEPMQSSKHGTALRLDGLESTNSNARERAIIVHSASYVQNGQARQGRSWGCPAVPLAWMRTILDRVAYGSFMYAYGRGRTNAALENLEFAQGGGINPAAMVLEDGAMAPAEGE